MLAGHREHSLDHHVVGDDALDEQVEVVGPGLDLLARCRAAGRRTPSAMPAACISSISREPAADVLGLERHHLGHEAVEEGGVARLVDELRGEEDLDLARSAPRARTAPGRRPRAPRRCRSSTTTRSCRSWLIDRRREPLLLVDREVDLVRPPVLPLPERVQVLVAHQLRRPCAARLSTGAGRPGRRPRRRPRRAPGRAPVLDRAPGGPRARARRRRGPPSARSSGPSA